MNEKWDGIQRRNSDTYLKTIDEKTERSYALLRGEFGDIGINGEHIEGRTSKALRELKEDGLLQNSRIAVLEKKSQRLEGSAWIIGILFTAFIGIGTLIIIWIRR